MFEYKRIIKKSIMSHTLPTDIFGYGLVQTGFTDKYLAGQVTMYKSYNWLKKIFKKELNLIERQQSEKEEHIKISEDYVWICWLQGMENAPELVQICFNSVRYWLKGKKVIVITSENYKQYVELPDFIIEKWKNGIISNTHFSDLLRVELLIHYGGLWLDATTFLTGDLPEYITRQDFFVYRNGWMDMEMINMASWLIYSRYTNNIILLETKKLLYKYWEKYNYIKNYFLLHMFFRMVTDKYQVEWEKVPYFNQIDSHLLMEEFEKKFDPARINEIKRLTSVHKLSYKFKGNSVSFIENYLNDIYK